MSLLLNVFNNFSETFIRYIKMPSVIVALCLAIIGLAIAIIAKRVTMSIRKTDSIEDNDAIMVTMKVIGIVLLFVALMIIIFRAWL